MYATEEDNLTQLLALGGRSNHRKEEAIELEHTCAEVKLQQVYSLVWSSPRRRL